MPPVGIKSKFFHFGEHKGKYVCGMNTPLNPIPFLYSKTGVCGSIPIFLIFVQNIDRLWELVRTALLRRFYRVPISYVLSKILKISFFFFSCEIFNFYIIFFFLVKFSFLQLKKKLCILYGQVFVMMMLYTTPTARSIM